MASSELEAAIAEAEAQLPSAADRCTLVCRLRALHEQAARTCLGAEGADLIRAVAAAAERHASNPALPRALAHLQSAERYQWEIGSWASGAGEGLSSMWEVRGLQLAQAWLLAVRDDPTGAAREEALRLVDAVEFDANRPMARRGADIARVRARLRTGPDRR